MVTRMIGLQLAYLGMAVSCNAASLLLKTYNMVPVAPTALGKASIFLAIYGLIVATGGAGKASLYRVGMAFFVLLIPVLGIVPHLNRGFDPQLYHSASTWVLVIVVNIFGVLVSAAGVIRGPR